MTTTAARVHNRRRTVAQWTAENPVLAVAEIGVATGGAVPIVKVGDGVTAWNSLEDLVGPELASSDPAKVGISTVGGVTTLDVEKTVPEFARKIADQTVNNSTTLVDCTDLVVPVDANAVYWVDSFIISNSSTIADIQFGWTTPAGVTGTWCVFGAGPAQASGNTGSVMYDDRGWGTNGPAGGGAQALVGRPCGVLITAGTAGTLQFRFAQNTLEVSNTIVLANSSIRVERIV